MKTRILLVDDHAIVRAGFRYLLETDHSYDIREVDSAEAACSVYTEFAPQVVVMDMMMPGMGGLEGVRRLIAKDEDARILVLSMRDDPAFVARATKAGARGYVTKRSAPEELDKAVRTLLAGRRYFSSDVEEKTDDPAAGSDEDRVKALSEREFEVFCLLAEGRSVVEISESLHLSPKTVSNHRSHIMEKLGAKNIVELTRLAIRSGLIDA
ncbi:MAG: response regulator transcription factor [Gammaproteobacteria bacterium]|nr:response regulator transcription factor [Chromatiales bacterium]MDX5334000.1 response regulator transcription factor [Gammaproteobacteria bacterium]